MKVVFMGTPDFAVPSLKVINESHEVAAVITAPDKPAGRGKKLKVSAVKEFALQQDLKIMQPVNLKDADFQQELRLLNAELFVVVAFRMLPEAVWNMPVRGTINLHASLLPQYRGAAPINWAVINGEKETGLSTFFIQQEIDTGGIILQKKMSIGQNETAGELHDRMMEEGAELLIRTIELIETDKAEAAEQTEADQTLKPAPKIFKEDCHLDWNKPAVDVHNKIRGLSPFPGAFSYLNSDSRDAGAMIKLFVSEVSNRAADNTQPGTVIIENGQLYVACKDFYLCIHELQMAGKKRMRTSDFLRGYSFGTDSGLK